MKQRKDGRWVKLITINGKRKPFYSTAENEKKAEKDISRQILEYNIRQGNSGFQRHSFKDIAFEMLENQSYSISFATQQNYRYAINHLEPLFDYPIEEITPIMTQNLLNELSEKNYSKSAMSKVKTTIGLILKFAVLKGYSVTNFSQCLKIPKTTPKKVLSPDDVVIDAITKNVNADFGLWALTLLYTGFRPGEVNALQKSDIDFNKRIIKNTHAVEFIENQPRLKDSPKTEAGIRTVPLLDLLYEPLLEHCNNLSAKDTFVFGGAKPLTKTQITKRWKKYCSQIGHKFTQYQLRHAYALILYRAGVDPKTAQYLLGHADFTTTMNIYTQFSKEKNTEAATKINDFISKSNIEITNTH